MSWSDKTARLGARIATVLVAGGLLVGCGFHPLYGDMREGGSPAELADIKIGPIKERRGQILRNELLTLLSPKGEPERPRYLLRVTYTDSVQELAIGRDQFATRGNLHLNVGYSLIEQGTGQLIFSSLESRIAAFNVLRSEYATEAARDDAFERAANGVARDIQTRLAVFFLERRNRPQPAPPS